MEIKKFEIYDETCWTSLELCLIKTVIGFGVDFREDLRQFMEKIH